MKFNIKVKQTIIRYPEITFSKEGFEGNLEDILSEIKNHPTIADLELQDLQRFLEEKGFAIDDVVEDAGDPESWEVLEIREI